MNEEPCDTCKHGQLEGDKYPCVNCCHCPVQTATHIPAFSNYEGITPTPEDKR